MWDASMVIVGVVPGALSGLLDCRVLRYGRGARADVAADFLAAGFRLERNTVMTASAVREPPHPNRDAICRTLQSEDDWRQLAELRLRCNSLADPEADRVFVEGRTAAVRRLVEAGHGAWFGAFLDGWLVALLGLFTDRRGVARRSSSP
jgi:hypothetical protein